MKKTINAAIGGCSFTIDDEAYETLNEYLEYFKKQHIDNSTSADVMNEVEARIADLLKGKLGERDVVDRKMAEEVIGQLGYPAARTAGKETKATEEVYESDKPIRKLFRDPDGKRIAGVCSGLAIYLGIDVVVIRILFLIALICGSAGFWIYLVIWIAAPEAKTPAEKCALRGIPATTENMKRFTQVK